MEAYTVMMPIGINNPRKRPMVSEPFDRPIPSFLPPLSQEKEAIIVKTMFTEINTVFGLALDTMPDLNRDTDPSPSPGSNKTILVGASHMTRIAKILSEDQDEVMSLCTPGWTPSTANLASTAEYIRELNPTKADKVLFDPWANCAFMGTDETGLPSNAFKVGKGGHYHILGHLQAAPKQVFRVKLEAARDVIVACGEATVVLVAPLPRYLAGGCCDDASHITNLFTDDIKSELLKAVEHSTAAVADLGMPNVKIFTFFDCFGTSQDLFPMSTSGGEPIWAPDAVHFSDTAYTILATVLQNTAHSPSPTEKRERLDSLVPGPQTKKQRGPTVPPPLWAAGLSSGPQLQQGGRGKGRGRGPFAHLSGNVRAGRGPYRGRVRSWTSHPYFGTAAMGRGGSGGRARGAFRGSQRY
jgi:hypothetical protein